MNRNILDIIITEAIWAPSGDNSQPWRFEIRKGDIKIFNVPERDTSLYNYNQNASLVALGGVVENIKIAAPYYGYKPEVNLSPEGAHSNLVATVVLKEALGLKDPLYQYIRERATNRKPYELHTLSLEHKREILEVGESFSDVEIKLVDSRGEIEKLADAASLNEKVVLENRELHNFLFSHITWSKSEDEEKKGFFIKTLELKGPQKIAFRLFSNWRVLKLFNKIGVSNFVSRDNTKLYKKSGTFVAIIANDSSPISFLKSGMLMQRFWLKTTKLGLGVQPLTGVLFLHHRIAAGDKNTLSPEHASLIEKAYSNIDGIFGANGRSITMMFRLGYADKPSARCLRKEAEITHHDS